MPVRFSWLGLEYHRLAKRSQIAQVVKCCKGCQITKNKGQAREGFSGTMPRR